MAFRILFLGENWYGSCARACCYALRRLGCDVFDIDVQTFFPQASRPLMRAARRLVWGGLIREYNDTILDTAAGFEPDAVLVFKGPEVEAKTLCKLRERGILLLNYYPDTSAFVHGTKQFWDADVRQQVTLRGSMFLPHGYDPELHRPMALDARDIARYGCDVSVVANHMDHKERILRELVRLRPGLDLRIWGHRWRERCESSVLGRFVQGRHLHGIEYTMALNASRITLGVMSGPVPGASQGDETSTRTYEIPACGGFMLHERSEEVLSLFEEGKEMACFGSVGELAEKIDYYLSRPEERVAIARAGHARCVPAYSYDNRMAEIVKWCEERRAGVPRREVGRENSAGRPAA